MNYFFILGNNPTLSVAELYSVIPTEIKMPNKNCAIIEQEQIDAPTLIKRLGGVIKIGKILGEIREKDLDNFFVKIIGEAPPKKIFFGISNYSDLKINIKKIGLEVKRLLKEKGISSRFVEGKEKELSSVIVTQNKLLKENGFEFIILKSENKLLIGQTLTVQPFKELSFRDYGRPARDDRSGMLPPKLAQIMINLAQAKKDGVILDPFCGSGTILTEAMLMGYKNLIGTDISQKAVDDTKKNMEWTIDKFRVPNPKFQVLNKDARELSKTIEFNSVGAIITEPYLGPQRGKIDFIKVKQELEKLYSKALKEFLKILKPNGGIVIIFPVLRYNNKEGFIYPNLDGYKIINPVPLSLQNNKFIKLTNRDTIIYGREGQKIWREVAVFRKI